MNRKLNHARIRIRIYKNIQKSITISIFRWCWWWWRWEWRIMLHIAYITLMFSFGNLMLSEWNEIGFILVNSETMKFSCYEQCCIRKGKPSVLVAGRVEIVRWKSWKKYIQSWKEESHKYSNVYAWMSSVCNGQLSTRILSQRSCKVMLKINYLFFLRRFWAFWKTLIVMWMYQWL